MTILIFLALLALNGELPPADNPGEYPSYTTGDDVGSEPVVEPVVAPVAAPVERCGARCEARGGIEARNERRAERLVAKELRAVVPAKRGADALRPKRSGRVSSGSCSPH